MEADSIDMMRSPAINDGCRLDESDPVATAGARLRITEIFHSLQGEARDVGWPTVFVRLTGCPLRCVWCDTEYAFHGGDWRDIADIVDGSRSLWRAPRLRDRRRAAGTEALPGAARGVVRRRLPRYRWKHPERSMSAASIARVRKVDRPEGAGLGRRTSAISGRTSTR